MDKKLVRELRQELAQSADERYCASLQRFFREPIDAYGVRTADVRRISKQYFSRVKILPRGEVFELCELLHRGGKSEEHGIAFSWAGRLSAQFTPGDFRTFERWLKDYVSNWAACDNLCTGPLGEFLLKFREFLPRAKKWTSSANRWVRRASAVALIPAAHKEQYLDEAFATADALLCDEDDMVQKGYGWLLKEISNRRPREVFDFVMKRKATMPRTALRYAIEKLPPTRKKQAMAK
jgi:3-methyladenine DNA glycosylase AlkD